MYFLYINSFLTRLCFCFNYFIPSISSLYCLLSQVLVKICPRFAQFFVLAAFVLAACFLHWSLEEYILVFCFLFSFLCSLFLSFFRHFMFVLRFDHFRVADGFVCLYFLLVVSCAFAVSRFLWIHMSRLQHPLRLHKNPGYSVMIK